MPDDYAPDPAAVEAQERAGEAATREGAGGTAAVLPSPAALPVCAPRTGPAPLVKVPDVGWPEWTDTATALHRRDVVEAVTAWAALRAQITLDELEAHIAATASACHLPDAPASSLAIAETDRRLELFEELVLCAVPSSPLWVKFLDGFKRRHNADTLRDLSLAELESLVAQAQHLSRARAQS